jgi:hypothetical protein
MKKLAFATLTLVLTASLGSLVRADDSIITITKASDTTAKVAPIDDTKDPAAMVPIAFDSGADWSCVKDSYTVAPDTASALMSKKETISIGTDGTATFHSKK